MLIFKYLQIFLIKMVESGICDDQANQAGIHGHIHVCEIVNDSLEYISRDFECFPTTKSNIKFPIVPCYQLCALAHYFATADPKIG